MDELSQHVTHLAHGTFLMCLMLILTAFLEYYLCWEQVQQLLRKKGGSELYRQALVANLTNVGILGALTYWITVAFACHPGPLTIAEQIRGTIGIVIVEGFLFFMIHKVGVDIGPLGVDRVSSIR